MARFKNVEIPNDKKISIALTYIYGIGRSLGVAICNNAKVDPEKKTKDLTNEEESAIRSEIDNHITEGDLRREVQLNIKGKMEINSYQGIRHKKGLPVRGQRTSRNARTRKGPVKKVIANKKKVSK